MTKRLLALVIAGLLASCAPKPDAAPTHGPQTITPRLDPTATPGLAGKSDDLSAWKLLRPDSQPGQVPPIFPEGLNYRLRPDWPIQSISYRYSWVGLGGETDASAAVTRGPDGYRRDGAAIPAEDVAAFVAALDNLYPVQSDMTALGHTDDYPNYHILLAGADGQEVAIFSGNTANSFGAPWTIRDGGQLYVQYDGALVPPLAKLLGDAPLPGQTERTDADIVFETAGFPAGGYQSDTSEPNLSLSYEAAPPAIAGTATLAAFTGTLELIDLKKPDESSAICDWTKMEDLSGADWATFAFDCTVPEALAGADYAYALFLHVAGAGPKIIRLTGTWGEPFDGSRLTPPVQWQAAADGDPVIQDLLRDHVLLRLSYGATVNPTDPLTATLQGDALLIGQAELQGQAVRYSVETPFAIKDGALTRWELDRASLETLLADALAQPLTRRVLEADPRAIINLRYVARPAPEPEGLGLLGGAQQEQRIEITACGAAPGGAFPSATAPLRGVSYGQAFDIWPRHTEFLLIDGQLVAASLDLFGPDDERHKGDLYAVLAPDGLDAPLDRIWLATDPFWGDKPVLTIWGASDAQIEALKLPAASNDDEWGGVTLRVGDDGRLRPEVCR